MKKTITLLLVMLSLHLVAQNNITWGTTQNVATSASGNQYPRIVFDGHNNPLVIWNNAGRVMFSRWNYTTFTVPIILSPASIPVAGGNWMGPDIASHGDTVYVVFKQTPEASDTCHIFCVHSYNGGLNFSAPVRVDYINDSISRFPTVTTDGLGNPIVGYMKFNHTFGEARWVVVRSTDFGNTFSADVKASGWSSLTSTVCDCCPGAITSSANTVAMLYRDNNSNIRDTWVGLSSNNGTSFANGMDVDQQNWYVAACPASGPDGVIIGDTLYSTYMNGASGTFMVYYSKSSISSALGSAAIPITATIAGLTQQNYPRIAASGKALAIVWKQFVGGAPQCVLRFTNNIIAGLPMAYDTIALNNITTIDVALSNGSAFVVWEDDVSGTVKYRRGAYLPINTSVDEKDQSGFSIYPNPAHDKFTIKTTQDMGSSFFNLYTIFGASIKESAINSNATVISLADLPNGLYLYQITDKNGSIQKTGKLIKE